MIIANFIKKALKNDKKNDNLSQIEKQFKPLKIRDKEAQKIITSLQSESIYFGDDDFYKLLSLQEILDIREQVNVKKEGVLPLIYCGHYDYITYDFVNYEWCIFNSKGKFKYLHTKSILEII